MFGLTCKSVRELVCELYGSSLSCNGLADRLLEQQSFNVRSERNTMGLVTHRVDWTVVSEELGALDQLESCLESTGTDRRRGIEVERRVAAPAASQAART